MIGKGAVRSERVSFHTLTIQKLLGMVGSFIQNHSNSFWKMMGIRVGVHMYDREGCSEKCESLIHLRAKKAKFFKLIETWWKGDIRMYDRQRCSEKCESGLFHTLTIGKKLGMVLS